MTPRQELDRSENRHLPVVLPKHTELVSAADGRHTHDLTDYHEWLAAPKMAVRKATQTEPVDSTDTDR